MVGAPAAQIAAALLRLGALGLPRDWSPAPGLDTRQAETLRKMLLAVVADPRLVLARLAEELVRAAPRARAAGRERAPPAPWRRARSTRRSPTASASGSSSGSWRTWPSATSNPTTTGASPARSTSAASIASTTSSACARELARELQRGGHRGAGRRAPQAHLQHLAKDAAQAPRLRAGLRRARRARRGRTRWPTAMRRSASCTAAGPTSRASSTTTSPRPRTTTTARSTRP